MSYYISWDEIGERLYETGVDRGVLYPVTNGTYGNGVAWNGLSKVSESPSGAEPTALYANNKKYLELLSAEEFAFTLEAYVSPEEFDECDGSVAIATGVYATQQSRKMFGLCYRSLIGNDTEGTDKGYKIHLVYGAKAKPSSKERSTVNDSPEAANLSWECSTTPVDVPGFKVCAHFIIDSTKVAKATLEAIENILYGTGSTPARLPMPAELITLMGITASYAVTNMLTNITSSNSSKTIAKSAKYEATLTPATGCTIANVVVVVNGVDVTSTVYAEATKKIEVPAASVVGPITIFAVANKSSD